MRHSKPPVKLAMLLLFPLLLCCGLDNIRCSTLHENREDLRALLDFKQGINDPYGALSNWTTKTHFCRWNGVNCSSSRPWRVTKLNLTGQGLGGPISSSLGNLTFLETLVLSKNNLIGPIPLLNKLQHLKTLILGGNSLQGVIPDALTNCSNLAYLDLSVNNLTGPIPTRIGFLSKLVALALENNNLDGVIPPGLGNITTLQKFSLAENNLSGTIPDDIWQMPNITVVILDGNKLSGRISQNISNLSLQMLSLTSNMLSSTLPSNIGDALPNLRTLWLSKNMFEGTIPASLGNASDLEDIDLSENHFTGQIPSSLGNLSGLYDLILEDNMLEAKENEGWEFFHALANCRILKVLSLSLNQLQGVIPNSIANLSTSLTNLIMGGNYLSGTVPSSIGKFNKLIKLSLDGNNLTGTIDEWVRNLTSLQHLNLEVNNLIGTFPPSISSLTNLTYLSLANNKFTGFLPPSLGNLQRMTNFNLSHNKFQGGIPVAFGNLQQLVIIDLSWNNISGEIPATLGQCQLLTIIEMGQNLLVGIIPTTFDKLYSLSMLNLSHNKLSGPLPDYLNDLKLLSKLDLSYNNFQGEIPRTGIFDNATVVLLDGNPGLCGGSMDLHKPSCHNVSRRTRIVNYLVKILIPIFGFMSLLLLVYFLLLHKKTSSREQLSQLPFVEHFEKVTYNDLAQATRDFSESNLIGRGSYGSVYSGKLKENKMEVAVKVFDLDMRGAERSFLAECEALRSIQHRNLLPILTACSTVDSAGNVFKALVYELMPNGNLDTWIHHRGDEGAPKQLSLIQRVGIAVNIADALDYLHHDCGRPTVHCDLKPSNILLNDDMNALLGDFGIARLYADPQSMWAGSISSIGVKGTIGYIPPGIFFWPSLTHAFLFNIVT